MQAKPPYCNLVEFYKVKGHESTIVCPTDMCFIYRTFSSVKMTSGKSLGTYGSEKLYVKGGGGGEETLHRQI